MIDTFANRLKIAMSEKNINLTKLSNMTGISKPLISNYLSGNYEAKQQNIYKLAEVLEVTPAWLMGYDVPIDDIKWSEFFKEKIDLIENHKKNQEFDELDLLFSKNKDILTEDDKEYIKFIIEKRKKEIDKQLKEE